MTSLDETARRPVETQNDRRGLLTNVRKKTSLQQSVTVVTCIYLGSCMDDLKDRVLSCSVVYRKFMRSKNVRAIAIVYQALP